MGQEMYIVTSPDDVLTVYKEPKRIEFDSIVKDIMGDFGCTGATVDKMFDTSNGTATSWMDLCHADFKLQMHPGEKLQILQDTLLGNVDRYLHWDRIAGPMLLSSATDTKTVSLWKWCGNVLVDSATSAFFGSAIYRVAPNILADFFPFDDEAYKLPYRLPEFAAKTMYEYKRRGEAAFRDYLSLPTKEREDASWIAKRIEQGMSEIGITEPTQCGAILFSLHRL